MVVRAGAALDEFPPLGPVRRVFLLAFAGRVLFCAPLLLWATFLSDLVLVCLLIVCIEGLAQ